MKTTKEELDIMTLEDFIGLVDYYQTNKTYWKTINQFAAHAPLNFEMTPMKSTMHIKN